MTDPTVAPAVREFVMTRFLDGEDPARLTPTTPLISGGVVDSLGLLDLVAFLEQRFEVEFDADEVDPAQFDTLEAIDAFLQRKLAERGTQA
jgi:acyl carrier protein